MLPPKHLLYFSHTRGFAQHTAQAVTDAAVRANPAKNGVGNRSSLHYDAATRDASVPFVNVFERTQYHYDLDSIIRAGVLRIVENTGLESSDSNHSKNARVP